LLIAENTEELKKHLLELNDHFKGLDTNYNFLFSFGIYPLTNCQIPFDVMRSNAQLAKNTVKGNYEINIGIYDESINDFQTHNNEMVAAMATGLKNGEFVAYYQPKFSAQTEQLVGAEALVRWQHNGTLIPPDSFISLFEKNGLISKLDYYMLDMVCQHLQLLHKQGYDVKPVSVNFSRSHLYEENFLDQLASIIARYQIPSRLIIVEFTEYAVMSEKQGLQKIIDGIHAMGMKLSIDDFGSGYSSLNMLQDFDFDEIKLDRQFLVGTTDLKRQHLIISSLLDLAKKLGMETIVEGVETRQQLLFLRQQHCDAVQGYLFAPPLKIDQYDKLLLPKTAIKNMPSAN
jgi:EAL domain-containing protein (putative c-di-GMP-specific phosphodiesterase class I)